VKRKPRRSYYSTRLKLAPDLHVNTLRPGITESGLNQEIFALAEEMYGIETYWHKRIVRAGKNTLLPYADNPADLSIGDDEILFVDLGPVFEEWEADFGRTFVLGSDPFKHKIRRDIGTAFDEGKKRFNENPEITGTELFQYAQSLAEKAGWGVRRIHCGPSHRPVSARKNSGRQGDTVCAP
jgi:Xaa-Pro dipeptidase